MKIFITGLGVISSIGDNLNENFGSLQNGKGGIEFYSEPDGTSFYAGRVKYSIDELKEIAGVEKKQPVNRSTLLGLIAAREAWKGMEVHSSIKTGIISGTTFGQIDLSEVLLSSSISQKKELLKQHDNGASTDMIANALSIKDYRSTISTACSSSANAIMLGARLIRNGLLDRVIVGGSDSLNSFTMIGFHSLLLYDNEKCKPFDDNRNGLNLGEAGAFLVLESEKSVKFTQNEIFSELIGWGNACDSFHPTGSSPNGQGASIAIEKALKVANISIDAIDSINAHGTGTKNNDLSESIALLNVFKNKVPPFYSTKSYTGHTLAAAGGLEAVFSILAIRNNLVFPSLNFDHQMKEVSLSAEKQLRTDREINKVLSNSFGFGGNCTELIFSK